MTSSPLRQYKLLFVVFFPFFAFVLLQMGLPPMMELVAEDVPMSYTALGLLVGIGNLASVLLGIPGGYLVDRHGGRRIGLVSLGLMVLGGLLTAVPSFAVIFLGRFLIGVGGIQSCLIANRAVVHAFSDGRRLSFAMGVFHALYPLACIMTFGTFRSLALSIGWQGVSLATSGVAALAFLVFLVGYREDVAEGEPTSMARALTFPAAFWVLVLAWILFGGAGGITNTFLSSFLAEDGTSQLVTDRALVWIMVGVIPGTPLLGLLLDRLGGGSRAMMTVAAGIAATILWLVTRRLLPVGPLYLAYGFAVAGMPVAIFTLIPRFCRPGQLGVAFGLMQGVMSLGAMIGPVGAGLIRDRTGSLTGGILLGAGLTCVIGLSGLVLSGMKRSSS